MTSRIVAHCEDQTQAQRIRDRLRAAGIDVEIAGDAPRLQVRVPSKDFDRATTLVSAPSDDEIAEAVAARPEVAAAFPGAPEPFDDTPTDIEVDRVLKGTVFGLLFFPVQIYTLTRLIRLHFADPPVRPRDRWKMALSYALTLPLWGVVVVPLVLVLGRFDPGPQAAWRNQRFTGLGETVMTVDLPGEYAFDERTDATVLGRAVTRIFACEHAGLYATVMIFRFDAPLADPATAPRRLARSRFDGPGVQIESIQDVERDGFSGTEVIARSTDPTTGSPRIERETVYRVGEHLVSLFTNVPRDQRDSRFTTRFFDSLRFGR